MVERVLIDLTGCHMKGEVYCGARKAGLGAKRTPISLGSMEMQVVADKIEAKLGLTQTMRLANEHRSKCGLKDVGQLQKALENYDLFHAQFPDTGRGIHARAWRAKRDVDVRR